MKTPFLIWLTLGFGALSLLTTTLSLGHTLWLMTWAVHMPVSTKMHFGVQLASEVYLILLIHALVRRPPWGRGICISYALLLAFVAGSSAMEVRHHWSYLSHHGVSANLKLIYFVVAMGFLYYAYKMAFGSRPVRDYFSPPAIETDTPEADPSTSTPYSPTPAGTSRPATPARVPAQAPAGKSAQPDPGMIVQHGVDLRDLDMPPRSGASQKTSK